MAPTQNGNNGDFNEPEHLRKIFIGGLTQGTTTEMLQQHFEEYGTVVDVVVMKDSRTQKSKGFGFVTYSESAMVDAAQQARPHTIDGRTIEVKRAVPREEINRPEISATCTKVYVGRLNPGIEEDDLRNAFAGFGNIISVNVVKDKDGKSRGYGFVEFDDHDPVDKIVLQKDHEINGQSVDVKKSQPKQKGGDGGNFGGNRGGNNDRMPPNRNRGNNQGGNFGNRNSGFGNQGSGFGNNAWNQGGNSGGGFNSGFGGGNNGFGNSNSGYGGSSSGFGNGFNSANGSGVWSQTSGGGFNSGGGSGVWAGAGSNSFGGQSFGSGNSGNRGFGGGNGNSGNFRNSNGGGSGQFNNGGGNRNFNAGGNKFGGGNQARGAGVRNHPYGNRNANAVNNF